MFPNGFHLNMLICDFLHQFISISDIVDGDYPWDYNVGGGRGG